MDAQNPIKDVGYFVKFNIGVKCQNQDNKKKIIFRPLVLTFFFYLGGQMSRSQKVVLLLRLSRLVFRLPTGLPSSGWSIIVKISLRSKFTTFLFLLYPDAMAAQGSDGAAPPVVSEQPTTLADRPADGSVKLKHYGPGEVAPAPPPQQEGCWDWCCGSGSGGGGRTRHYSTDSHSYDGGDVSCWGGGGGDDGCDGGDDGGGGWGWGGGDDGGCDSGGGGDCGGGGD